MTTFDLSGNRPRGFASDLQLTYPSHQVLGIGPQPPTEFSQQVRLLGHPFVSATNEGRSASYAIASMVVAATGFSQASLAIPADGGRPLATCGAASGSSRRSPLNPQKPAVPIGAEASGCRRGTLGSAC